MLTAERYSIIIFIYIYISLFLCCSSACLSPSGGEKEGEREGKTRDWWAEAATQNLWPAADRNTKDWYFAPMSVMF